MPNARLTVKAMETWLKTENKSMADSWDLSTPSPIYNKEILVYNIMKRGGSLEVLEYDPDLFYTDCAFWWAKWNRTIEKWVTALQIEYNPLENYDRNESWTDSEENDGSTSTTRSTTEITDGDTTNTRTLNTSETNSGTNTLAKTGTEEDIGTEGSNLTKTGTETNEIDEDTTLTKTGTETDVMDKDTSLRKTGTVGESESGSHNLDSTTETETSAYNVSTYSPKQNVIVDQDETNSGSKTTTYNTTDTGMDDTTDTKTYNTTDTSSREGTDTKTFNTNDVLSKNSTNTKTYNTLDSGTEDSTKNNSGTIGDVGTNDQTVTTSETISGENGGSKTASHEGRLHGNIGVTTSQQMLISELDLQYWNLYDHIADLFIQENTTRVY